MKLVILKDEKDFAHHRFKKSFSSPSLRLRVAPNPQNLCRFGFIVPKKILARAHERNKIRRRLKSIAQKSLPNLKPADILVFPQKTSLRKTFADLETEFVGDIKRLNLWKA